MLKRIKPITDFNQTFSGAEMKVIEVGHRKAYSDSVQAQTDVKEFPHFVRIQITDDPSGINTDAELQIKLRNVNGVEVGERFTIGHRGYRVVGGQLTFWSNKTTYHGKEWVFTNVSAKGDRIDAWN